MEKTLLCNCCFMPVLENHNCPMCGCHDKTERCEECRSIKLMIPSPIHEGGQQLICQECAYHSV